MIKWIKVDGKPALLKTDCNDMIYKSSLEQLEELGFIGEQE